MNCPSNQCEGCAHSDYPGIRYPAEPNGDNSRAWVERCDTCELYDSDDNAAVALSEMTGYQIGYALVWSTCVQQPYMIDQIQGGDV